LLRERDTGDFMSLPTISIVTPSFNQSRFIEWTIRSVLLQDYPQLEYIVMDGGSTDGTCGILERYRRRFHHFESAPDQGQADAVARGFAKSSGDILAYLNSDDMLAPGVLADVAEYFARHPHVDVIYSHRCFVSENNQVIGYWWLPPHSDYLMTRRDYIPQETCFWRRSIYDRAGGINSNFRFALDYDLFVRFMRIGRFRRLNRFLGAFRKHAEAKTASLMDSVGQQEIESVWRANGMKAPPWSPILDVLFQIMIDRASRIFAQSGRRLPGTLGGTGFDYGALWGGKLDER
jgi:glycosyltransferase involved in cell wall biosynthesis